MPGMLKRYVPKVYVAAKRMHRLNHGRNIKVINLQMKKFEPTHIVQ